MADGAHTSGPGSEVEFENRVTCDGLDPSESCLASQEDAFKTTSLLASDVEGHHFNIDERCRPEACEPSKLPDKRSNFRKMKLSLSGSRAIQLANEGYPSRCGSSSISTVAIRYIQSSFVAEV